MRAAFNNLAGGIALCALFAGPVLAQSSFPSRPITMVVPLPAGGTSRSVVPLRRREGDRDPRPAGGG